MSDPKFEDLTFTITCTMRRRWAEQFLGLLKWWQMLGSIGSSRITLFFADGDGDFRPKFEMPGNIAPADPQMTGNEIRVQLGGPDYLTVGDDVTPFFDAG